MVFFIDGHCLRTLAVRLMDHRSIFKTQNGIDRKMNTSHKDLLKKETIRSEDLFQGQREVVIIHGNSEYRLMITKSGKLILNK